MNEFIGVGTLRDIAIGGCTLAGVLMLLAVFLPSPKWVEDSMTAKSGSKGISKAFSKVILFIVMMGAFFAGCLIAGLNFFLSSIIAFSVTSLIVPMINSRQEKKVQKQARQEALGISEYIAGRLTARATLFRAIEDVVQEHHDGRRDLSFCIAELDTAVRSLRFNADLPHTLSELAQRFKPYAEMYGLWSNLATMSAASLSAEASIEQADEIASNIRAMDELKTVLETELTISTLTRLFMFMLIGGFILYLVFFGGSLGEVLTETLAGNGLIGFALFMLYIAQLVGTKIENLPPIRF